MSPSIPERSLTVLHVDDDPLNLRVVADILDAFGHTGVAARSGGEALEHLAHQPFDVVLLDIHMPMMSGLEVLQRLRAAPGPERLTPVIALTADVVSRRAADYIALGFDSFVSKPILVAGLLEAVSLAAATRRPPHANTNARAVG